MLAGDYFLLVFISCCGLLQLIACHNKLHGLSFFKRTIPGYIFGALAIAGAFCWFFLSEDRCVPGLVGPQMFALFIAASLAAILVTLSLASLIKGRPGFPREGGNATEEGLDALRERTYFQAIARHFRKRGQG